MNKPICLWSCPRNVSTALMYSFAQREDTQVYDEPLYAHYLRVSGEKHPGRQQVLDSLDNDGGRVVKEVILQKSKDILFHKLMTHFLVDLDKEFLLEVKNIIFIRNPKEIIQSYNKVIPNPKMEDIGVKQQYELYLYLKDRGRNPIVLDSKYLLIDPNLALNKLCSLLEIPFDNSMLKWKKGVKNEDGVWAKYWYSNVHASTGFIPYVEKEIKLKGNNLELALECKPYYDFLITKAV